MTDTIGPVFDLQMAMVTALKANAELTAIIATRINPEQSQKWPGSYITVRPGQELDDSAACLNASEVYPMVHVWSRESGYGDVTRIAAVVKNTLNNVELTLTENTFVLIELHRSDFMDDPDGVTKHIALTFRALTNNRQS